MIKFKQYGIGPDIVLLHGWAIHSGIWNNMFEVLKLSFRVTLIDLPGYGQNISSFTKNEDYNFENIVAQIIEVYYVHTVR